MRDLDMDQSHYNQYIEYVMRLLFLNKLVNKT